MEVQTEQIRWFARFCKIHRQKVRLGHQFRWCVDLPVSAIQIKAFVCVRLKPLYLRSDPAKPEWRWHKFVKYIVSILNRIAMSSEQRRVRFLCLRYWNWCNWVFLQRLNELQANVAAALKEALGDRMENMFYLNHLATTPAKQNQGYGSTLCTILADQVGYRLPFKHPILSHMLFNRPMHVVYSHT